MAKLGALSSSLRGEIAELWLGTLIIVVIASVIRYVWSTRKRKTLAEKYRRRSSHTGDELFRDWYTRTGGTHSGRE